MPRLYLVRHGRASAGWNTDPDPGLDAIGSRQAAQMAHVVGALGPMPLVSSPMQRCQQTAAALAERWTQPVAIESAITEIPSPEGVAMADRVDWLRVAMRGRWSDLPARYAQYRQNLLAAVCSITQDTVMVSHFVAINVVIGQALGDDHLVIRSLDNCSVTVVDVDGDVICLEQGGHEADTLIR